MKEQDRSQDRNRSYNRQQEAKRQRRRKKIRQRRIAFSAMLLASFLLGFVFGGFFSKTGVRGTANMLAFAQETSGNSGGMQAFGGTEDGSEGNSDATGKNGETTNGIGINSGLFADIPDVKVQKPVDYTLNQALNQLEKMISTDERYETIIDHADEYPEKLLINLANNPEMISFVADYQGYSADTGKAVLSEEELKQKYPLFLQWDKRWGYLSYGDESCIAISGCGPTTLSMAVVALTGNEDATPAAIAKFAMDEGYYMYGTGTKWSLMTDGAAAYGVDSEQINISKNEIMQHLDEGNIVICSMRNGDFTTGGHFIMLYGYDDEGFYVNDPFCVYRSGMKWDYDRIRNQMKAVWAMRAD